MNYFNQQIAIPKLLITHYNQLNLSETELVLIIQLINLASDSNEMPSFDDLSKQSTLSTNEVAHLIQSLIQKNIIAVHVDQMTSQSNESFSLKPLEDKLDDLKKSMNLQAHQTTNEKSFERLFERFEVQFARPLTPIEMQTLTQWLDTDHYSLDIIEAALNESVIHNKLSFKYIDRILLNWSKNNVKSVADSKEVSQQFKQKKLTKVVEDFPVFDWVNGESPYDK